MFRAVAREQEHGTEPRASTERRSGVGMALKEVEAEAKVKGLLESWENSAG